ncbi:hypothetical protein RN001_009592 [Aquatica leii]|uniref:Uncharacterized protein n=1 Tax=Aquatica leii TaxID=1421715 RepID=A0AAN7P8Y8_9COLE|nr:hypothetical protein RN001_009592 [Aquatica leii]
MCNIVESPQPGASGVQSKQVTSENVTECIEALDNNQKSISTFSIKWKVHLLIVVGDRDICDRRHENECLVYPPPGNSIIGALYGIERFVLVYRNPAES